MVLKSISNKGVDVAKWIGLAITIVGLVTSVVVWASGEHADLKDNARSEVKESVKDLKDTMREQYTPLMDFQK